MIMNRIIPFLFLILCTACFEKKNYTSPPGYDLNNPQKFIMPQTLEEISGIEFYKGSPDTLYAQQDEEGVLFRLQPGDTRPLRCRFAKNGDYEDLAICNDWVIMLKSNGNLYVFPFSEAGQEKAEHVTEFKELLPEGEFEGMYADEQQGLLYVLCKQGCSNKKDKTSKGFILQLLPDGSLAQKGAFTIDVKEIEARAKDKFNFHPAALAFNSRTAEWFVVSSVNKLLVITDPSWKVKEVHRLNPSIYIQSEGIVFDKDGNLYISNEGNELSRGNMLKIPYTGK